MQLMDDGYIEPSTLQNDQNSNPGLLTSETPRTLPPTQSLHNAKHGTTYHLQNNTHTHTQQAAEGLDCCFGHFVEWMVQYIRRP